MIEIVPKLISVEPLENMLIRATFEDGTVKTLDISGYVDSIGAFSALKNESLFNSVRVDIGGFGIVWNDSIDLDRHDIWEFGTP